MQRRKVNVRRLVIGNAVLAIAIIFIMLISSVNTEAIVNSMSQVVNTSTKSPNYLTITSYPSSATAGQSFSGITVTAYDYDGDILTNYKGHVYFTSTDPKATLPYTVQNPYIFKTGSKGDKGVHTFSGFNLATAGLQTITVTDGSMSAATSSITVSHSLAVSIVISPTTQTITAGSKQLYTSSAKDYYGNSWDITAQTGWSISSGAGGSWSANTYTSALDGTWTVTGSYSGFQGTASLTVNHYLTSTFSISSSGSTEAAGSLIVFTATAFDTFGNAWDVTSSTSWTIDSKAGGSWSQNSYTCAKVGNWVVKGTFGSYYATVSLTVVHGVPVNVAVNPKAVTISAGSSETFTAAASDFYGNSWDVSSSAAWGISSSAGGLWSGGVYTSSKVGMWTVTCTYGSLSDTSALTVGYASVFGISISPKTATLSAGSSETFTVMASDIYGNSWDVTNSTIFSLSTNAGGFWSANTYTSAASGTWTITGTYKQISNSAILTVNNGSPNRIVVASTTGSIFAGQRVTFTATAFDGFGNSWDVSSSTVWGISLGAGGSWSSSAYTSAKAGLWAIMGTYGSLSNSASLTVVASSPVSISLLPKTSTLTAGSTETFTATAFDGFGNSWDVSGSTVWGISLGTGGSWSSSAYTSAKAGAWVVTGTYGSLSDTSSLSVPHGSAISTLINPKTSAIIAGSTEVFTTTSFDNFGNNWDSTSSATFTIDQQASGSLSGNSYLSCNAGTWTVTATSLGISDAATLIVSHASPVNIKIGPNSLSITAGSNQAYTSTASDQYGNTWGVTSLTTWVTSPGAQGSWNNNIYSSAIAGSWTITGNYSNLSDFAYLTVNHATAISINVYPKTAIITAGSNEAFSAMASDVYQNTWEVSSSAKWTIDSSAGGLWTNNNYASTNAGNWIVTASLNGLSDTASLTVNHGSALKNTITPSSSSLTAGSTQTYSALASDSTGNSWAVSDSTTWSIDSGAGGFWLGNSYTSSAAGTWTITGTYSGQSTTTLLTVNHGSATSITIGPDSASVLAGSPETFTATASDSCGNTWDVTDSTAWSIDAGAGGSWSGNVYASELSGTWNVTGTFDGISESVFLTVNHASESSIIINPYNAYVAAGTNEIYTVTAFDSFGNTWDDTSSASWSITTGATGSWAGNNYSPAQAGTWTITATVANLIATTPIIVNHGLASTIRVSPKPQTITSGSSQTFSATALDSYGNSWDVTGSTVWSIDSSACGSWMNNIYTSDKAGNWLITGSLTGLSDSASLTVNHGSLVSIQLSPANASISIGSSQVYNAIASDANGNKWDITNLINWNINSGAGGNWVSNSYNSANVGNWTVTATSAGTSGTAQLAVYNPIQPFSTSWLDLDGDGAVSIGDILYFVSAYHTFASTGFLDNTCDFNHDGQINFQDLVTFIMGYIAYQQTA